MPVVNDDSGVDIEPVWSKSNIARRARRHKIASKRSARREDILTRHITSRVARTALQCSMYKEVQEEMLEYLGKTKKAGLLENLNLAPCVSKCHSSASRAAEKLEERVFQRHRMFHASSNREYFIDNENKKHRGGGVETMLVLNKELDCIKYIVLRETYLGTTQKTAMKLDGYFIELNHIQEGTYVGGNSGVFCSNTVPDKSVSAEFATPLYFTMIRPILSDLITITLTTA